jgi:polyhydroxyalkanoate synthesis regulator phasin
MAQDDDPFKRYQEVGAGLLDVARARAEELLQDLARMGDVTRRQAGGALDELVEGSGKETEGILASIRREIAAQLSLLGIATKQDLADLERRLTAGAPAPGAGQKAPSKKAPAKKAAAKKAPAKKAAAKKGATKKGPASKSEAGEA